MKATTKEEALAAWIKRGASLSDKDMPNSSAMAILVDFKSALRAEIETRHKSLSADAPKQISEFGRGVYWAAIAECELFLDLIETTLPPSNDNI